MAGVLFYAGRPSNPAFPGKEGNSATIKTVIINEKPGAFCFVARTSLLAMARVGIVLRFLTRVVASET